MPTLTTETLPTAPGRAPGGEPMEMFRFTFETRPRGGGPWQEGSSRVFAECEYDAREETLRPIRDARLEVRKFYCVPETVSLPAPPGGITGWETVGCTVHGNLTLVAYRRRPLYRVWRLKYVQTALRWAAPERARHLISLGGGDAFTLPDMVEAPDDLVEEVREWAGVMLAAFQEHRVSRLIANYQG